MRQIRMIMLLTAVVLAACTDKREAQEAEARDVAKRTISKVIFDDYPAGFPVSRTAECVVEHATEQETFQLVEADLKGITGRTTLLVREMLRRPETKTCLDAAGIRLGA